MAKIPKSKTVKTPVFTRPSILLHPNIPKPMHGMNPRSILGKEWWDIERKKASEKNNNCCYACGVHRSEAKYHPWLEGHESYVINYVKGSMRLREIVSLCHACHNFIHSGRLKALFDAGEISLVKYRTIKNHGKDLIKGFGTIEKPKYMQQDWSKWHLIIDGKKYYSKFKNVVEWSKYYGSDS